MHDEAQRRLCCCRWPSCSHRGCFSLRGFSRYCQFRQFHVRSVCIGFRHLDLLNQGMSFGFTLYLAPLVKE